jgi:hypothetical protein
MTHAAWTAWSARSREPDTRQAIRAISSCWRDDPRERNLDVREGPCDDRYRGVRFDCHSARDHDRRIPQFGSLYQRSARSFGRTSNAPRQGRAGSGDGQSVEWVLQCDRPARAA